MVNSPNTLNPPRFLGINFIALWRDLKAAWRGMLEWRVIAWLWPAQPVRLWLPGGTPALSKYLNSEPLVNSPDEKKARFEAIVLPEAVLLRRTLQLPKLQPAELHSALSLEAQSYSPFSAEETLLSYEPLESSNSGLQVHLVLTSRKLVTQTIESYQPPLGVQNLEVWVPRAGGAGCTILPGYENLQRRRQNVLWRWVVVFLAAMALVLAVAVAASPTVQLYLRALQADKAMQTLVEKAAPVIAQRDAFVRTTERLSALNTLIGKPLPTPHILNLVTQALPDDTSLLSLKIQGLKVSLSGQTPNAAVLMKQLGATPGLHDVKAPSPAIKPLGATRESFTIEFMLDPAQAGSTP